MEKTLSRHDIPYHVENGHGFFQRFEVRILLDYLRLIQAPDSEEGDEALRSIINVPNRYMGRKFLSDLEEYSASAGLHLYKGLKNLRVGPPYLKKSAAGLVAILDPLMENATKLEPAEIIMMLREALDFDRFIAEDDIPSPDDLKLANIQELQIMAGRFKEIGGLLSYAETFREEKANDKNGVSLMTIHKAKGLEFPVVFVIGMVEGILPNKNGEIEEERRIAFVGMSRAMRLLYLAYSRHCLGRPAKPSSFLQEIFETG